MPPAARIADNHVCTKVNEKTNAPHVGGPVTAGSSTVMIDQMPAARVGDGCTCAGAPGEDDSIAAGSPTVLIDNVAAARLGDGTNHGGRIVQGSGTVLIDMGAQGAALGAAAASGSAFCEECEGGG